jgi:hypothetical protein
VVFVLQADVSSVQGQSVRARQAREIHNASGHRGGRRLSLQVSQFSMDGFRKGRPGNAKAHVHTSGFAIDRGAVDEQSYIFPQAEVDKQHIRQARICEYSLICCTIL